MYVNLELQFKKLGITNKELTKVLKCTGTTVLFKCNGFYKWKLSEMRKVKAYLISKGANTEDVTLDKLFGEENKTQLKMADII